MLLSSCGGSSGGGAGGNTTPTPVTGSTWTFMVYMATDNNLDLSSALDLKEMMAVGSTANINVIVQYDSRSTPTRLYRVDKDQLVLLKDLGELNMASSTTLKDFIVYGITNYPADHYALIVSSHGDGWTDRVDKRVNAVIEDWNNTDIQSAPLSNREVAQGIAAASGLTGKKLSILGFDACLMALLEVAYEFKDSADILVSSQTTVQGYGWDYKDLLGRLTASPAMSAEELAKAMVASYRTFAESSSWGYGDQTISAIRLGSSIETLAKAVDSLALSLKSAMTTAATRTATLAKITSAVSSVQQLQLPGYYDLWEFSGVLDPSATTNAVQSALGAITLAEYHGSSRYPKVHGLSIVFIDLPTATTFSAYSGNYRNYNGTTGSLGAFINAFNWDEMMNTYFDLQYPDLKH
jgi:hypothetical protein